MTAIIRFSRPDFEAEITKETMAAAYEEYIAFIDGLPVESGGDSFEVLEMVATMHEGKTYWKAKGLPPFHKYGLTVWDEVFEATGNKLSSLSISDGYIPPQGTIAEFVRKDDGKPSKVSKIIFPTGAPELAQSKEEFFATLSVETGITDTNTIISMLKLNGITAYNHKMQAATASVIRRQVKK